ncbi:MAG: protein translocase subunit SecD, partial [Clostridia bacterium]
MNKKKSNVKSIVILTVFSILIVLGAVFAFVSLDDGQLGKYNYTAYPKTISFGLDLSGGAYAVYQVDETTDEYKNMTADERKTAVEGTRKSLEDLLFGKGYTEAQVTTQGATSGQTIRVEVPNVDDPERLFELIGRPASLEFKKYDNQTKEGTSFKNKITGNDIEEAGVSFDNEKNEYVVALKFNKAGAKKFADATAECVGGNMGIYINNEFVIAPGVSESITGGSATISGGYTYDTAYELAVKIQAGSFPLKLNVIESNTLTATLGENAIKAGVISCLLGLALIIVYLCVLYKGMGIAASLSLIFYTMTYVFFLSIFPWVQLTLSGIAGVLLSIGMAVDANVIIFERVKEEYASGKNLKHSISTGFKRSYGAILDGNVTTIIGAIVLIVVGAASIKGFGITLLIGIILSLLSSLLL